MFHACFFKKRTSVKHKPLTVADSITRNPPSNVLDLSRASRSGRRAQPATVERNQSKPPPPRWLAWSVGELPFSQRTFCYRALFGV